jgi:hypothetical protein
MSRKAQINPHFRRVFQRLSEAELSTAEQPELTLDELGLEGKGARRVSLAFGTYSLQGLRTAFEAYGMRLRAEERGLAPLELRLSFEDPFHPRIVAWSPRYQAAVVDLSLRRTVGAEVGLGRALADCPLLYLDALTLQHPGRAFDWSRPPLPGQVHPGIALSAQILELLLLMARRIGAEALALTPSTFAAACVYERHFSFVDGAAQGRFQALRRAGHPRPRWLLAWAVELGCVYGPDGAPVRFTPSAMLSASSPRTQAPFTTRAWSEAVKAHAELPLSIDYDALHARLPWERMPPGPPPERIVELLGYDPLAPR